jgi:hypothetical protein
MSIELADQSGEYDAGTIMEVATVICLNNLTDKIQGSYHNISPDYIPLWNDWSVGNFGSRSNITFICPRSESALRAVGRHDSAKNKNFFLPKITPRILGSVNPPKKNCIITVVN